MRILVRTSRTAGWARRFGSLALPLVVIPVFLHRAGIMDSATFALVEVIGLSTAALGLVLGVAAYVRLWFTGDRGWGKASTGVFLGLLCLSPLVYAGIVASETPFVADVSTDPDMDFVMEVAATARAADRPPRAAIRDAFPNAVTREYRIGANHAYRLAEGLVRRRGWEIVAAEAPRLELAQGRINAIDMTLLGWRDEVAIRIAGTTHTARVDVRSASLAGSHDLGRNGRRIEAFLLDLDAKVTEAVRNAPPPAAPPQPALPRPQQ